MCEINWNFQNFCFYIVFNLNDPGTLICDQDNLQFY